MVGAAVVGAAVVGAAVVGAGVGAATSPFVNEAGVRRSMTTTSRESD